MIRQFRALLLATLLASPLSQAANAHPHVFVDTGVEAIFDSDGHLTHLRVIWAYDDFYSLLVTEDMGLDPDGDGILSAAEQARLSGFDMQWVAGFNGDLVASIAGKPLDLSGPQDVSAELREGRVITIHQRAVSNPPLLGSDSLRIKPFDPTHYTAYDVTYPVRIHGRSDCSQQVTPPDIDAGLEQLQAELQQIDALSDVELDVGDRFATLVTITCAAS